MSDCNCTTTVLEPKTMDPAKRVRYTMGLVLGVDEFQQEQTYFAERDRLHQRALHGYGTVKGLRVGVRPGNQGPVVAVGPGLAVDPQGHSICVPAEQCAQLDAWLNRHRQDLVPALGSPPGGPAEVYVVLCYRECEADLIPVPSGPCRSQEDTRTASRILDAFDLRLTLQPPLHAEEAALRAFGQQLRRVVVSGDAPHLNAGQLLDLARSLFTPEVASPPEPGSPPEPASPPDFTSPPEPGSPPESPPGPGSPPGVEPLVYLHPDNAGAFLHAAIQVWVTEVRPTVSGACAAPPGETCVLLARLAFEVEQGPGGFLRVADTDADGVPDVVVDESARPFLLSTRLLQEWLSAGWTGPGGLSLGSPPGGDGMPFPYLGGGTGSTQIMASSWAHGKPSQGLVDVQLGGGGTAKGLVMAFGQFAAGDRSVLVEDGSLDEETFQAFIEKPDGRGFWLTRAIRPRSVLPVNVLVVDGVVTAAAEVAGPAAPAAAFVFDDKTLDRIGSQKVSVVLKRAFVRDTFGDRLGDDPFESWFYRIAQTLNLNTASEAELQELPKIGPSLAARIVAYRTTIGSFLSVDDLLDVDGIGEYLVNFLRPYVYVA